MLENIFLLWNYSLWSIFLRWPRELNALQLQKTHANRKSTSKSRKHLHQFDSRCCKILTTQTNKGFDLQCFLYLVALWVFAARVLSNWRSCFPNLHVYSEAAGHWALSATVIFAVIYMYKSVCSWSTWIVLTMFFCVGIFPIASRGLGGKWYWISFFSCQMKLFASHFFIKLN